MDVDSETKLFVDSAQLRILQLLPSDKEKISLGFELLMDWMTEYLAAMAEAD